MAAEDERLTSSAPKSGNYVVSTIKPDTTELPHPEIVHFSALDNYSANMDNYVPLLLLYRLKDNSASRYCQFVDDLEDSLSKVLVTFYPLAGRVVRTSDPSTPRQLLCDDEGAIFVEISIAASLDSLFNINDLQPLPFLAPAMRAAGLDIYTHKHAGKADGSRPALIVQVSRFNCGGVALTVIWNHLVADCHSMTQFKIAWAQIASSGATSMRPYHNRLQLTSTLNFASCKSRSVHVVEQPNFDGATKVHKSTGSRHSVKILYIKRGAIDKMQREVAKDRPEVRLSTVDLISARLWRCLSRAYSNDGNSGITVFESFVECRKVLEPRLPSTYFGNCLLPVSVAEMTTASELASKSLLFAAQKIHNAVQGLNQDTLKSLLHKLEQRDTVKTSCRVLKIVSMLNYPLNQINFGYGNPVFAGPIFIPKEELIGQCFLIPSSTPGDAMAVIYLHEDTMTSLWSDSEFLSLTDQTRTS